jgi:hypothetical protein
MQNPKPRHAKPHPNEGLVNDASFSSVYSLLEQSSCKVPLALKTFDENKRPIPNEYTYPKCKEQEQSNKNTNAVV